MGVAIIPGETAFTRIDGAYSSAADAVRAAALDPSDDVAMEEAADHELLWYATQEAEHLLAEEFGS